MRSARRGDYANEAGRRTLERVVGRPLTEIDDDDPLIVRNSFPERVARTLADPAAPSPPPLFLLHGEADTLLPARQSERLCDALGGRALEHEHLAPTPSSAPSSPPENEAARLGETPVGGEGLRRVIDCDGAGGELHLIAEGEHALDLCIAEGLCLAGSGASAVLAADSVARMLEWSARSGAGAAPADDSPFASGGADGGTGAVSGGAAALALLLLLRRRRRRIA